MASALRNVRWKRKGGRKALFPSHLQYFCKMRNVPKFGDVSLSSQQRGLTSQCPNYSSCDQELSVAGVLAPLRHDRIHFCSHINLNLLSQNKSTRSAGTHKPFSPRETIKPTADLMTGKNAADAVLRRIYGAWIASAEAPPRLHWQMGLRYQYKPPCDVLTLLSERLI